MKQQRLVALDWMRGIVMILMVTDHASEAFNADRLVVDSAFFPGWDQPFDTLQFLFRWLSHLCAPVFVFLAGSSLALSISRRVESRVSAWRIDRDLIIRGLVIIGVEVTFIDWMWFPGGLLLQVMFAIGSSFLLMIGLRRLPSVLLIVLAPALLLLGEYTFTGEFGQLSTPRRLLQGVLLDGGYFVFEFTDKALMVAYPTLPWCAIMILGFVFGRWLVDREDHRATAKKLFGLGALSLTLFAVVRGLNGSLGNLGLTRVDDSLVRWLQVSKYPPSLTFIALELGIMLLILAALFRIDHVRKAEVNRFNPVLVFGQTAFFFYVAHIFLLETAAQQMGLYMAGTLREATIAVLVALVVLYPACLLYRRVKSKYSRSLLRYF